MQRGYQRFRFRLLGLQFPVKVYAHEKPAVAQILRGLSGGPRTHIGCHQIFWSRIGPVSNWREPLVIHLRVGGPHLAGWRYVKKRNSNLDLPLFSIWARRDTDPNRHRPLTEAISFFRGTYFGNNDGRFSRE